MSPKRSNNSNDTDNNEENNITMESEPSELITSTPIVKPNPINNNPILQRHISFNKRLSSTSISSWESENWVPSPPITSDKTNKLNYNTFSSIEEVDNDDYLKRTDSSESDMLKMKALPSTSSYHNNDIVNMNECSSIKNEIINNESQTSGRGSISSETENIDMVRKASTASTRRSSLKRQSKVSRTDEENWREMPMESSPNVFLSPKSGENDNAASSSFHSTPEMVSSIFACRPIH